MQRALSKRQRDVLAALAGGAEIHVYLSLVRRHVLTRDDAPEEEAVSQATHDALSAEGYIALTGAPYAIPEVWTLTQKGRDALT